MQLFERSTRSVALTAGGHTFLPHAYRVLEDVETARHATRASAGDAYGRVTIGFAGVLNHLVAAISYSRVPTALSKHRVDARSGV